VDEAGPCLVRITRASEGDSAGGRQRLIGSGVSVGSGIILTAASVVGPARTIDVLLSDMTSESARVVGVDRRTNMAVLEVDRSDLPSLELRPEVDILPGEFVVVVGFGPDRKPVGSFGTVVVVKGPNLGLAGSQMVQVTAPPFPGHTGGVLLNRQGHMVGLVSGWMSLEPDKAVVPAGSALIAGFVRNGTLSSTQVTTSTVAIHASQVAAIAEEIQTAGFVRRGYLGMQLELSRRGDRAAPRHRGVMLHGVVEDGPARAAGLLPGDVILEYAGVGITSPEDLFYLVSATLPGSSVPVRFLRRGRHFSTTVTLQQAPELEWVPETDSLISAAVPANGLAPTPR
jgi:serine protease Do